MIGSTHRARSNLVRGSRTSDSGKGRGSLPSRAIRIPIPTLMMHSSWCSHIGPDLRATDAGPRPCCQGRGIRSRWRIRRHRASLMRVLRRRCRPVDTPGPSHPSHRVHSDPITDPDPITDFHTFSHLPPSTTTGPDHPTGDPSIASVAPGSTREIGRGLPPLPPSHQIRPSTHRQDRPETLATCSTRSTAPLTPWPRPEPIRRIGPTAPRPTRSIVAPPTINRPPDHRPSPSSSESRKTRLRSPAHHSHHLAPPPDQPREPLTDATNHLVPIRSAAVGRPDPADWPPAALSRRCRPAGKRRPSAASTASASR